MNKISIWIKSIILPLALGAIVGLIIMPFMDYKSLEKPLLSPPSIIFPIVWTILYLLMGISYALLKQKSLVDSSVNISYYVQLVLNLLWPIAFFVFKWRLFAFIWILLLDIAITTMIRVFFSKDKLASVLQVPYFIWSLFATYLNLGIYILNK